MGYDASRCNFQDLVLKAYKQARKKSGKLFVMLFTDCTYICNLETEKQQIFLELYVKKTKP